MEGGARGGGQAVANTEQAMTLSDPLWLERICRPGLTQRPGWTDLMREQVSAGMMLRCDGLAKVSSDAGVPWKEALEEGAGGWQPRNKLQP